MRDEGTTQLAAAAADGSDHAGHLGRSRAAVDISLYILPAPSDVLMAVIENFSELMYHASVTLSEALIGLGLSALLPSSWRS